MNNKDKLFVSLVVVVVVVVAVDDYLKVNRYTYIQ
jgi:hypothetical protein